MATSAASSEHFEKLHEIFRGLHEELRGVPERLLGTGGTGEAGNSAPLAVGGKALTLSPDPSLLRFSHLHKRPRWLAGPGAQDLPAATCAR